MPDVGRVAAVAAVAAGGGMTTIGIDPSLTRTAVAILHDDGSVTIRQKATTGRAGASVKDRALRLTDIASWIFDDIFEKYADGGPWAIEGPSIGSKNAAAAHDRSGLWWLIVDFVASGGHGLPIVVPPTVRAKYATGKGNAGKDEVLAAVVRRYDNAPVENHDQADAFVIAMIAARLSGSPLDDPMPKTHLSALDKLELP